MEITVDVPASEEQAELIADHLLVGEKLYLLPTERAWIKAHTDKMHPGSFIKAADLDLENAKFKVTLVLPNGHSSF